MAQHIVAFVVPVGVVNGLKLIHIKKHEAHKLAAAFRGLQNPSGSLHKKGAACGPGQGIIVGDVADGLLLLCKAAVDFGKLLYILAQFPDAGKFGGYVDEFHHEEVLFPADTA